MKKCIRKSCKRTGELLTLDNFTKDSHRKDGLNAWCKECRNQASKKFAINNPSYIKQRHKSQKAKEQQKLYYSREYVKEHKKKYSLMRKYNLTEEELVDLHKQQEYKCKICGQHQQRLDVDHCHSTNGVRGLLCGLCNKGLGHFKDDIELLEKAISYLRLNGQTVKSLHSK